MGGTQPTTQLSPQHEAKINTPCHMSVQAHRDNTSDREYKYRAITTLPTSPCPPHLTPKFDRNTQQRLTRGHHDTAPQPTPLHLTKACPQHNATQRKSPSWICIPTEYQHWPAQRHGHPALHRTPTQEPHHSLLQQRQMNGKMSSTLKSMPNVYKPTSHP